MIQRLETTGGRGGESSSSLKREGDGSEVREVSIECHAFNVVSTPLYIGALEEGKASW